MIVSIHRTATLTLGIGLLAGVGGLAGFPAAARAQTWPDGAEQTVPAAFTPPSPSTIQPSAPGSPPSWPADSTPSAPTPPAGATPEMAGYAYPVETVDLAGPAEGTPLIPPNVEGNPYAAAGGGYCYVGPHPVDTRVVPGAPWDPTTGQHVRPYPPIDARLFSYQDGCYYFTGDPRDFGYGGQTYAYYGAHPVLAAYGGGWCFMMGGHAHLWAPWSPYFTVVGPWNYWQGAYDPFFWSYWPYYSFYYRSYYPHYYGGGRFYRDGYRVAPPIHRVPASAWRGATPGHAAPIMRGAAPMPMNRGAPQMGAPGRPAAAPFNGGRPGFGAQPGFGSARPGFGAAPPASGGFGAGARPSFSPGPRPSFSPGPRPSFSPGPRPSFSAPRPSFSPGPSFSAPRPSSGGFRGGGMGSGRGHR